MAKLNFVRVVKTQYSTYSMHYVNPGGRRRRLSVGPDERLAFRQAEKFEDWLMQGKDPESQVENARLSERAKSLTLNEFFPIFMQRHGSQQSTSMQRLYQERMKAIRRCPELSNAAIGSIRKSLMLDYMHARMKQDKVAPATVNREASMIRCMLSRATEWDVLEHNPLRGMKLFREAEKREVNLTEAQASKLLQSLPEPVARIVEFAIYTGFRKENVLGLRIEDVRFHDGTPTGEARLTVKGRRVETLPLGANAVEVVRKAAAKRESGYVFLNPKTGTRYGCIHATFDRAVRKLGLRVGSTKFRFHDLRHVFASWLHQAGVTLDEIRPLLAHRSRATTDRYATLDKDAVGKKLAVLPKIRLHREDDLARIGKLT